MSTTSSNGTRCGTRARRPTPWSGWPRGYDERFSPDRYQHLHLERLDTREAAEFSERITNKRFVHDDEMRVKVADRMREASQDPSTARLMATPLQVTIMSLIVEKYPNLPPDRFTLFNLYYTYYTTVSGRESAKEIPIARFLNENRRRIDRLHEEVGLILQTDSEAAAGADAAMKPTALHELACRQLLERGFKLADAEEIAEQLLDAATKRLVLLAPRGGGVGFEIRTPSRPPLPSRIPCRAHRRWGHSRSWSLFQLFITGDIVMGAVPW